MIFKIDNLDFQDEALKILGVTFYNPQNESQLNTEKLDDELKKYVIGIERYFEQGVDDRTRLKFMSTCNAIIEIQHRPLLWGKADNSIYVALQKVDRALQILKRQKYNYVGGKSRLSGVNLGTYILTSDKQAYRQAPDFYDDNHINWAFTVDAERKKLMRANLKFVEGLANVSELHSKILNIAIAIDRYLVSPDTFTFRDFWSTICEPLFPNDHIGFISFSKRCFRIYLQRKFQSGVKIFMSNSLKDSKFNHSLSPKAFRKLGLHIKMLKPISAKTFGKQYSKISDHLKFEFLSDLLLEIDRYSMNQTPYFLELDNWLDNLLLESYAERNLEVHNNISTDLSLIKLRNDCLEIGNIILLVISGRIRKGTKEIGSLNI